MTFVDIFVKLLNMSFAGTVAAVMIMWLRLLYHVLPKKYLCILWCVVLIRLLCPFTFPELGIGRPIQEPIPSNIMEVKWLMRPLPRWIFLELCQKKPMIRKLGLP